MDLLAIIVALTAIAATIYTTVSSSTRNEAHHQATIIQDLLKEISEVSHAHLLSIQATTVPDKKSRSLETSYEALCSLKCDLLESTLQLLVRRCAREFLFDANSTKFKLDFISNLGKLRNATSDAAYEKNEPLSKLYVTNGVLHSLYIVLNEYIGERFRPIFEKRV